MKIKWRPYSLQSLPQLNHAKAPRGFTFRLINGQKASMIEVLLKTKTNNTLIQLFRYTLLAVWHLYLIWDIIYTDRIFNVFIVNLNEKAIGQRLNNKH